MCEWRPSRTLVLPPKLGVSPKSNEQKMYDGQVMLRFKAWVIQQAIIISNTGTLNTMLMKMGLTETIFLHFCVKMNSRF